MEKLKKLELSPQNFRYDVLHLLYSVSMNLTTMCMIQVDRRGPTGGHLVNCKLQIDIWNLTSHDLHGHVMAMCEIRPM